MSENLISLDKVILLNGAYHQLQGDTPLIRELNKRIQREWIKNGNQGNIDQTIMEILIEDYDKRSKVKDKT